MDNKKSGFSLVETLVVISIVGILSIIGMGTYFQVSRDGRNTKRKSDLKELQLALEEFKKVNNNRYPQTFITNRSNDSYWGTCSDFGSHDLTGANGYIPGLAPEFVNSLPIDPRDGQDNTENDSSCLGETACYVYVSDGIDYKLIANCTPEGNIPGKDPFFDPTRHLYSYAIWSSDQSRTW